MHAIDIYTASAYADRAFVAAAAPLGEDSSCYPTGLRHWQPICLYWSIPWVTPHRADGVIGMTTTGTTIPTCLIPTNNFLQHNTILKTMSSRCHANRLRHLKAGRCNVEVWFRGRLTICSFGAIVTTHRPYLLRTQDQEIAMTDFIKIGKRSALIWPAQEGTNHLPSERQVMGRKCHIIIQKRQQGGQSILEPSEGKGAMTTFFVLTTGATSSPFFA